MDCILNGVKLPSVNSDNNILFVDNYKEVFFDIYNIEINGKSFIAEFVENTRTGPLVKIKDFTLGESIYHDVTFLLVKEKADVRVHLNESNVTKAEYTPIPKIVYHSPAKVQELITEKASKPIDTSVQKEIQKLKEQALANIEKEKHNLLLVKEQVNEANKIIDVKLDEYKTKLLEHFYQIVEENKDTFINIADKKLNETLLELKNINNENVLQETNIVLTKHTESLTNLFEKEKEKILSTVLEQTSKDLENIISDIQLKVNTDFKFSAKELTDELNVKTKQIIESNNSQFEGYNTKINESIEESKTSLLNHFYKIIDESKNNFEKSANNLIEKCITDLKEYNATEFNQASSKLIQEKVNELTSILESNKKDLAYNISDKITEYTKILNNDINLKFTETASKFKEDLKQENTDFSKILHEQIESKLNDINNQLNDSLKIHTTKLLEEFYISLKKSENSLQSSSKQIINEAIKDFSLTLDTLNSQNTNLFLEKVKEMEVSYNNNEKSIKSLLEKVENDARKFNSDKDELINEKLNALTDEVERARIEFIQKLDTEIKITLQELPNTLNESLNRDEKFISEVYSKFTNQYGPKIDEAVNELFKSKSKKVLTEDFDFFKDKKVIQQFEQMVQSEWMKKETELTRKVKKLILDFYYTYGSGGGSVAVQYADGGTINGDLNVTGQILSAGQNIFTILSGSGGGGGGPSQVPYSVFARSGYTGSTAIIDYFALSAFNSAKYNIQVLSGSELYASTVYVMSNATIAKYTEYAVLHTTTNPYIGYSVATDGTFLQLSISAVPSLYNMVIKGVRLDPILQ